MGNRKLCSRESSCGCEAVLDASLSCWLFCEVCAQQLDLSPDKNQPKQFMNQDARVNNFIHQQVGSSGLYKLFFTRRPLFFYFGSSSRSETVKYSWLCCVLKIRLISTPRLFSSSASSLSFSEEQHKHVISHVRWSQSRF